jgi:cell wall-associated NlpC family hydrolase
VTEGLTRIAAAGGAFLLAVPVLIGAAAGGGGSSSSPAPPSRTAAHQIPPTYLQLYIEAAGTCPDLSWTVLAAIGTVESNNGQSTAPGVHTGANSAGAEGPMQFEPATFAEYDQPIPPGGARPPSPYDPTDAIYAAARDLCANGARDGRDLHAAIFAYNHANWYVTEVMTLAASYGSVASPGSVVAAIAVAFAEHQIGVPYEWGGDGPADGQGFDCSGLTQAAYADAGITLPRTAQTQYDAGPLLAAGAPLAAGDLIFFGAGPADITHVGIYASRGRMLDAPHTGADVRVDVIWTSDLVGASRPSG